MYNQFVLALQYFILKYIEKCFDFVHFIYLPKSDVLFCYINVLSFFPYFLHFIRYIELQHYEALYSICLFLLSHSEPRLIIPFIIFFVHSEPRLMIPFRNCFCTFIDCIGLDLCFSQTPPTKSEP